MNNEKHSPIEPDTPLQPVKGESELEKAAKKYAMAGMGIWNIHCVKEYLAFINGAKWQLSSTPLQPVSDDYCKKLEEVCKTIAASETNMPNPTLRLKVICEMAASVINSYSSPPLQPVKDEGAMAWLKREGYPDVMPMTLDNLGIILDRYTKYLSSPPEPSTPSAGVKDEAISVLKECDEYLSQKTYEKGKPIHLNSIGAYSVLHKKIKQVLSSPPEPSSKEQEGDAVGFAEWIRNEGWEPAPKEFKSWYRKLEGEKLKNQTTEQLYQLYKKKP